VTGIPTGQDAQQVQQQQQQLKTKKGDIGALQVGFFKEGGAKVVQDGARLQNPILDGDEELPGFDEGMARSMKGLASKLALQFEDFGGQREGGKDLKGFAQFMLDQNVQPDEAGVARLQSLADRPAAALPEGSTLSGLRAQLNAGLGISLPEDASFGQMSLVAGLATAGIDAQSFMTDGEIDPQKLSGQMAQVVRQGARSIDQAMTMISGVNQQVSAARTFVKR
jgi:hypothetical protein